MELQVIVHAGKDLEVSKEVVERIVNENIRTKLDNYLNKFTKEDAKGTIDVTVDKNKKGIFDGNIRAKLDGKSFHFSREDYKNMDDLINHLFDHFKEALSDM